MEFIIIDRVMRTMTIESNSQQVQGSEPCRQCGQGGASRAEDGVLRCECGSLMARYRNGQLELKCRRCKRTILVALERDADDSDAR
jgi:hypothetical protein